MYTYYRTINFYDCDPAGIIFYSKIFEICHSAYEEFIRSINLESDYFNNESFAVPIIHTEAEFFLPLKPADKISIEITVNQLRESSFELKYLCKNFEGKITNEVRTVHIFMDKKNWIKIPIDPLIKTHLEIHKTL